MEFIDGLIHRNLLNKVCLLHLDDDNEASETENEPKNSKMSPNSYKTEFNLVENDDSEINFENDDHNKKNSLHETENPDFCIPHNYEIGQATGDGNCFFDSFRQGLEQLGINVSNGDLRFKCRDYANTNPEEWFVTSIGNSHQKNGVRRETVEQYTDNIQRYDRWGDPDVEGRILCRFYNVSLYVIEKQLSENQHIYTSQIIDAKGCKCDVNINFNKENTIYIINRGLGHFEPILKIIIRNNFDITDSDKIHKDYIEITNQLSNAENLQPIEIFNKFENAIREGNVDILNNLIQLLYLSADKSLLVDIYNDRNNLLRETHLITLACKYNQSQILDFLLYKSNILHYLPNQGPVVDRAYVQALCYLMQSNDIHMLETLYDYCSGDVHWLGCVNRTDADTIITNLKKLGMLLITARDMSSKYLWKYQQMLVDVHCLISFNAYQIDLYTELSKLITNRKHSQQNNSRQNEVEAIISVLLTAFDVYEKYCNENIRLTKDTKEDQTKLETLLKEDSLYMKYWLYIMYEIYYRKLDYNMALLIINNLHSLKLRVKMESNTYQDIEATLYYFLYRVNEDWKLYLPEHRLKSHEPILGVDNNGLIQLSKVLYDSHRIYNGPVLYLERRKFQKSLDKFKKVLQNTDVVVSLRQKGTKIPKDEINNLSLLPYMRDDYSLKKILQYLEIVSYIDMKHDSKCAMLIIQRIIQITGEFFKCTEDSYHLSPTTLALLQTEISKSTYKCIFDLRDNFSHAKDRMLIKRIDLENNEHPIFSHILEDLKKLKKSVHNVIDIYKPILEKSLLHVGLSLIHERYRELPAKTVYHRPIIEAITESNMFGLEIYMMMENSFIKNQWKTLGFTRQLFREIACLSLNYNNLDENLNHCYRESVKILENKILLYMNFIQQKINMISEQNKVWESIKNDFKQIQFPSNITVLDHPNMSCIKNIKTELKKVKKQNPLKNEILKKIDDLKDMTLDWIQIAQLLNLIIVKMEIFNYHHWEIKHSLFTNKCNYINNNFPDNIGVCKVIWLVESITTHFKTNAMMPNNCELYKYEGLQTLRNIMKTKFFLTKPEMEYLKSNINFYCNCECFHRKILKKLYDNTEITKEEYEAVESLKVSDMCKKIIQNLAHGQTHDNKMLECLIHRTNILDTVLEGEREAINVILRYKHDPKFRIALEMIVSDIMNIFIEGRLSELVNSISTKLLAEYPLRHILAHGNPLLDISGDALDADDFPKALVQFSLDTLEDKPQLNDLFQLYEDCVGRDDVLADTSNNLNDKQTKLVHHFKSSNKWKSYVKLLPTKYGG